MSDRTNRLRTVLADLGRKRLDAGRRAQEIVEEREGVAFAAHSGGKGAAGRLAALRDDAVRIDQEIRELDAAIKSGNAQLAAAVREDAAEEVRRKARAMRPVASKLRDDGRRAAEAIAQITAALAAVRSGMNEIRAAGIAVPSWEIFRANLSRALDTALTPAGLQRDLVPPSQRIPLDKLIGDYASNIDGAIARVLDTKEAA